MARYNTKHYNAHPYNILSRSKTLYDSVTLTDSDIAKQLIKSLLDITTASDSTVKDDVNKVLTDSLLSTDAQITMIYFANKPETISLIESIGKSLTRTLDPETITIGESYMNTPMPLIQDIIFMDEEFSKQITNKGLFDIIRLNDWLSLKLNPSNQWSD